ncbi:hypothetical protein, partial [Salmonella sp. s51933]|uniref:hypothetical protein n=1 Tax=Salmonella sp. s51933 TaxID=3160127 RepID=UPI0037542842
LEEYGLAEQDGITEGWDWVQRKFECCGVNASKNWYRYDKANGKHNIVPDSCCIVESEKCGNPYKTIINGTEEIIHEIYSKGCFDELKDFLENHLLIMGILAAVFVVIELVAMVLASLLLNYFKNNSTFV